VKTLRETIAEAIYRHPNRDVADAYKIADDALATFREWLAYEKLVVVPREATIDMVGYAGARADARGDIRMFPEEYRNVWSAMIAAAPDALETKP
jgi:hypothetical protein